MPRDIHIHVILRCIACFDGLLGWASVVPGDSMAAQHILRLGGIVYKMYIDMYGAIYDMCTTHCV